MNECFKDKFVKVRKTRRCYGCYTWCVAGTLMRYWAGVFEGEFYNSYHCTDCYAVYKNIDREDYDTLDIGWCHDLLDGRTVKEYLDSINQS